MYDDMEMMRSSDIERKKLKRLHLIAAIPLICAACGPLMLVAPAVSNLLALAMLALWAMGTPFGLLIGPLVLNLRKDLYVQGKDEAMDKRVKVFAVLDIVFGVLTVVVMLAAFLLSASV